MTEFMTSLTDNFFVAEYSMLNGQKIEARFDGTRQSYIISLGKKEIKAWDLNWMWPGLEIYHKRELGRQATMEFFEGAIASYKFLMAL